MHTDTPADSVASLDSLAEQFDRLARLRQRGQAAIAAGRAVFLCPTPEKHIAGWGGRRAVFPIDATDLDRTQGPRCPVCATHANNGGH